MKAITLTQPWATLVAIGAKHIETRSWSTKYRGVLAIHAAKALPKSWAFLRDERFGQALEPVASQYEMYGGVDGLPDLSGMPLGVVVATCRLVRIDRTEEAFFGAHAYLRERELPFGDFTPGRFAWFLADVRALTEPIAAKGRLGLWEWDERGGAED